MESLLPEIGLMAINLVFGLYLLLILLRFLFQLVRADFYNPISQFILKATNPLLIPIRRLIPGVKGLDIPSLILAMMVQMLGVVLVLLILGVGLDPLSIVIWSALLLVGLVLQIYFFSLIIMVISSWIAPQSNNPALALIHQLLEPVTKPIRNILPDMGGIDLSPILIFFVITVLKKVVLVYIPPVLTMFV